MSFTRETKVRDIPLSYPANWADHPTLTSADIQLSILPIKMSDRLDSPSNVMGLAPGTDTQVIYVLNGKVESTFWWLLRKRWDGPWTKKFLQPKSWAM